MFPENIWVVTAKVVWIYLFPVRYNAEWLFSSVLSISNVIIRFVSLELPRIKKSLVHLFQNIWFTNTEEQYRKCMKLA